MLKARATNVGGEFGNGQWLIAERAHAACFCHGHGHGHRRRGKRGQVSSCRRDCRQFTVQNRYGRRVRDRGAKRNPGKRSGLRTYRSVRFYQEGFGMVATLCASRTSWESSSSPMGTSKCPRGSSGEERSQSQTSTFRTAPDLCNVRHNIGRPEETKETHRREHEHIIIQ